jgi:hypothetical protein
VPGDCKPVWLIFRPQLLSPTWLLAVRIHYEVTDQDSSRLTSTEGVAWYSSQLSTQCHNARTGA